MSLTLPTPEHDKIKALNGRNDTVGDFLEWLAWESDYVICEENEHGRFYPTHKSTEQLVAEHFGIDMKKLNDEKEDMLKAIRAGVPLQ